MDGCSTVEYIIHCGAIVLNGMDPTSVCFPFMYVVHIKDFKE